MSSIFTSFTILCLFLLNYASSSTAVPDSKEGEGYSCDNDENDYGGGHDVSRIGRSLSFIAGKWE